MPQFPFTPRPNPNIPPQFATEEEFQQQAPHPLLSDSILGTSNALLGLAGIDMPDSKANLGGQLVGAAIPLGAPLKQGTKRLVHPAVQKLLEMLDTPLAPPDLGRALAESRITKRPAPLETLRVPEGFELPGDFDPAARRPQNFREASLMQEGYRGGFNQTPRNAYEAQPWMDYMKDVYKRKPAGSDIRSMGKNATQENKALKGLKEINQIEQAPVARGADDLANIVPQAQPKPERKLTAMEEKVRAGKSLTTRGENRSSLTEHDVFNIRQMSLEGATSKAIAAKYGMNLSTIQSIISRGSWSKVK